MLKDKFLPEGAVRKILRKETRDQNQQESKRKKANLEKDINEQPIKTKKIKSSINSVRKDRRSLISTPANNKTTTSNRKKKIGLQ